jgi:hypothetical protein
MSSHPLLEKVTGERRLGSSVQLIAEFVMLMLNFGALVWFAAVISTQLADVRATVTPLVSQTNANTIAIAVINARIDAGRLDLDEKKR